MSPSATIGAAAPVTSDGQDLSKTMADKVISAMSAMARAAAERTGHNPQLADCFIRKEAELKIGDNVIDRPDSLLTLTAQEAIRVFDSKPILAAGIASSLEEMLKQAGLAAEVRKVEPTGFERVASFLTLIAPLLLVGGILGAYVEIKTPGFGLPGITSAICFFLFFTGSYLAGLAGWEVVIFFVIGLVLILLEVFVHPGTIIPGLIGFLLLLGSILWAMIDRYPDQGWLPTSSMLTVPLLKLLITLVAVGILIYYLAKYLPKTALYRKIVLGDVVPPGQRLKADPIQGEVSVGMEGRAHTQLRPSGKADFDGRLVDVVTRGDLIEPGVALRILAVEGPRVVVAAT
jgi:membrane-bound serine protease (ClpP class)